MRKMLKSFLMKLGCYNYCCELYEEMKLILSMLDQLPRSFSWWLHNYIIAYIPCHALRIFSLRHILGIKIGKGCFVHLGAMFCHEVEIGDYCVIGRNVLFAGPVTLGNNIAVSAGTWFIGGTHDKNSKMFAGVQNRIFVEDYVWTGMRSVVLPGVRVRRGCILGAHSVLTKSPPPWTVVAGVPARVVSSRSTAIDEANFVLKYDAFFN